MLSRSARVLTWRGKTLKLFQVTWIFIPSCLNGVRRRQKATARLILPTFHYVASKFDCATAWTPSAQVTTGSLLPVMGSSQVAMTYKWKNRLDLRAREITQMWLLLPHDIYSKRWIKCWKLHHDFCSPCITQQLIKVIKKVRVKSNLTCERNKLCSSCNL